MGLSPGNYTFYVRMLRDDGTMGDVESELRITILSPWYRSWWAWTLYILLTALIVYKWKAIKRLLSRLGKRLKEKQRKEKRKPADEEEVIEEAVMMDDDA